MDVVEPDHGVFAPASIGRLTAVSAPTSAIGDPTEFRRVDMHQLAGFVPFVTVRRCAGRADQLTGQRITPRQWWHSNQFRILDTVRAGAPVSAAIRNGLDLFRSRATTTAASRLAAVRRGIDRGRDEPAMDLLDNPNCPQCLTRLEVSGTEDHPYWWCPSSRVARLF
jgi:hypothetical protein